MCCKFREHGMLGRSAFMTTEKKQAAVSLYVWAVSASPCTGLLELPVEFQSIRFRRMPTTRGFS